MCARVCAHSVDPNLLCDQQVGSVCLLMSGRRDGHHAVRSSRDIFALLTDPDTGAAPLLDLSHYCPTFPQDNGHLTKKKNGKVSALLRLGLESASTSSMSKETYFSVKRDILQCQKRPITVVALTSSI